MIRKRDCDFLITFGSLVEEKKPVSQNPSTGGGL